jgi:hypothetical protein
MSPKRSRSRRAFIISGLVLVSIGVLELNAVAQTQPRSFFERIRNVINPRRRSQFISGRSRGGAVRGRCVAPELANTRLTALIPDTNLGLTVAAYPTFWFYVPYRKTNEVSTAEFMLLDEARNPVLAQPIVVNLPESPGIVRLQLPTSTSPLAIDQDYNWYFSINCSARNPSRNPGVSGWIRRVAESPELTIQLRTLPAQQRYVAYTEHEIWYEVVTELAQYRDRFPSDWSATLQALNLPEIVAQSPIIELQPL